MVVVMVVIVAPMMMMIIHASSKINRMPKYARFVESSISEVKLNVFVGSWSNE